MECVRFENVKSDLIKMIRRKMLIPVIGSGFTKNCYARNGIVPSGNDYCQYMIEQILLLNNGKIEEKELKKESFSVISSIYHKQIDENKQQLYLNNRFTNVKIDIEKKDFLKIDWPYIYTLNIDDGIENNSDYKTVLYSNREIRNSIFEQEKCVIKLHGDIKDILSYKDSNCEIFDQKQYVVSIKKNVALLKKLTHDYEYLNLIYIGCGLSDEIDLLYSTSIAQENNNARYYCTVTEPSILDQMKLEDFGITHCIIFDSFQDIYLGLIEAYKESLKIAPDELEKYSTYEFKRLSPGYDINKAYLFQGKSILDKKRIATFPDFFVTRELTDGIVKNINYKGTQIIVGRGCSGKTYVAYDIMQRVRDRDVYAFDSRDRINDETLKILLKKENCLVICDSKVLSLSQIELVLKTNNERLQKRNSFIILESKSNRDLASILFLLKEDKTIGDRIPQLEISNRFSKKKTEELNNHLITSSLGIFSEKKTIADNIISESERLIQNNKYSQIVPNTNDIRHVACLIVLATKGKAYVSDAINLDLVEEFEIQCKRANPLIERESTWSFEISASNNSPLKYVVNAEYWLFNQLNNLAKYNTGRKRIIDSYKYIVQKLIEINGKPDLMKGDKFAAYKDYILFDNIFQIFTSQGTKFIREIYETLNDMLATDPNYLHQRAKCYIRSAYDANSEEKQRWLEMAYRDASISNGAFEKRYDSHDNEKIMISADHALYTAALSLCHIAKLRSYEDLDINAKAVTCIYKALISPYNSIEFVNKDATYNFNNVVSDLITTFSTDSKYLIDRYSKEKLSELLSMIVASNTDFKN